MARGTRRSGDARLDRRSVGLYKANGHSVVSARRVFAQSLCAESPSCSAIGAIAGRRDTGAGEVLVSWIGLISGLIGLVSSLVKWAQDRQLIAAGEAQNALRALEQANAEVEKGRKARLDQRAANDADGGMSNDKFERPD